MHTKIGISNEIKASDHLVILADKDDFDWADLYLSNAQSKALMQAAADGLGHVHFPQVKRHVFVQFLKETSDETANREDARLAGAGLLKLVKHYKVKSLTVLNTCYNNCSLEFVEGMTLANYQFLKYFKDAKKRKSSLRKIALFKESASKKAVKSLKASIEGTELARTLVNEPLSYLTAEKLGEEIRAAGERYGFETEVLGMDKIQALKMGGLLAVNKGSIDPPTFSIMEWKPKNAKNSQPIVLVGKGVVYDTGGMSLKPTAKSMDFMKCDMGGAATVIGIFAAAASNNLPVHLIGLIPATDNRPGQNAYVPGDVVTMHSGSTVEVLNTDAEGRMLLADALHFAKKFKPELVMDFATLTGHAAMILGDQGICYMGNAEQSIKDKMERSGQEVYERLVEFPMWREFGDMLKSHVADLKNIGPRAAGSITAGKFLEHFTDYPWLHFDIAGPSYVFSPKGYQTVEGTGVGVRLIYDFLKNY